MRMNPADQNANNAYNKKYYMNKNNNNANCIVQLRLMRLMQLAFRVFVNSSSAARARETKH